MLVLWFIPRELYSAHKKAEFEYIYGPDPENPNFQILLEKRKRTPVQRNEAAKLLFNMQLQIAMASRKRLSSKRERRAVYEEHLTAITSMSQEDKVFKDLGINDKDPFK